MKLNALFENNKQENEIYDWIVKSILYKDAVYGGENQASFDSRRKKFEESELTPYDFFKREPALFSNEEIDTVDSCKISGNQVSCPNFIVRAYDKIGTPPFKFDKIDRAFVVMEAKNLKGPEQWFPRETGFLRISSCPNFDITGLDKVLKSCEELGVVGDNVKGSLLGLLKIKNLNYVRLDLPDDVNKSGTLNEITMKYLPASKEYQGGDILDYQDELIDAGFEEFAKP